MAARARATTSIPVADSHGLKKEMGLRDLVLAQVLCVVGSAWVGVAARLGSSHLVFWLTAMLLFYLPLAGVVVLLNAQMPLEGGVYQWTKYGFGDFLGFLTAWNLWVYALVCVPTVLFVIPTDLAYLIGPAAAWLPSSRTATFLLVGIVLAAIAIVAVRGLGVGKWLHNIGSGTIICAYLILLLLPIWSKLQGRSSAYVPFPWHKPELNVFALAVLGQMIVGGLSGFEYIAIMAGECRSAASTIGQSVLISAPVIALMFVLGTSSVLAYSGSDSINLIGPIPQTFRLAFGANGIGGLMAALAIAMLVARAIAAGSLIFTGLTRLPMTAGWDHLLPEWFTRLHPRWKTPVNSILFTSGLVLVFIVLSMTGAHEQEAMQLLQDATIAHYGLTYLALFALPIFAAAKFRKRLPRWLTFAAAAGLLASLLSVAVAVYPIVSVGSRGAYALKIALTVVVSNLIGVIVFASRRSVAKRVLV